MFLGELEAKQKDYFLDLGICMAMADGKFSDEEKHAIHRLCDEMRIEDRYTPKSSPEEAFRFFATETAPRIQRLVVIELLGIAMADCKYEDSERALVTKIVDVFAIDKREVDEIREAITRLYGVYITFERFINAH